MALIHFKDPSSVEGGMIDMIQSGTGDNPILLEEYTIEYDGLGNFYLAFSTRHNASYLLNKTYNLWQFYESSSFISEHDCLTPIHMVEDTLKQVFVDLNKHKVSNISIVDDDLHKFVKHTYNTTKPYLRGYSITVNLKGTYTIRFDVLENVRVDFRYNRKDKVYEAHLFNAVNTNESVFEKTFHKKTTKNFVIKFVTHFENSNQVRPIISIDSSAFKFFNN